MQFYGIQVTHVEVIICGTSVGWVTIAEWEAYEAGTLASNNFTLMVSPPRRMTKDTMTVSKSELDALHNN